MSSRQLAGWDGPSADVGPVEAGTGQFYSCNFFWYTRDQSLSRTQVQMGNRIIRFVKVIETNSKNAATAFTEIIAALEFATIGGCPDHPEALELLEKLKSCPNTVPNICDVAKITLLTPEVKKQLDENDGCLSQSAEYGKVYKECLFKKAGKDHTTFCDCMVSEGAVPPPRPPASPPCLPAYFDKVAKEATDRKKKCDIGNADNPSFTPGSWGDCQKALQLALQYVCGGTKACPGCALGPPITTSTVAPTGRRMRLNQQFMKFAGFV